jgi:hypothetical protein
MLFAGIVHEDVEAAETVYDLFDGVFAERLVADIPGDGERLLAFALDDLRGLPGVVMLAQIEDGDVRAFTGIEGRDRAAYAAVSAGDPRAGRSRDSGVPIRALAPACFRGRAGRLRGSSLHDGRTSHISFPPANTWGKGWFSGVHIYAAVLKKARPPTARDAKRTGRIKLPWDRRQPGAGEA